LVIPQRSERNLPLPLLFSCHLSPKPEDPLLLLKADLLLQLDADRLLPRAEDLPPPLLLSLPFWLVIPQRSGGIWCCICI
jgi:hypothetical protein